MAWVSEGNLAAAVSEAGGLGIIAGGAAPKEVIQNEIRKARALTKKPIGVNIMLLSPFADDLSDLVVEEKVEVVTTGAGSPGKYIEKWKQAGIKVIPVIPSVALAKRMERMGADAVVAEGTESGGHIGELTTFTLVPQVVDAVSIPVIAAGGIADKRGVKAAFALGADGVQCGTCFIVAKECVVHDNYKNMIIDANDTGTAVTGRSGGHPVRALKSRLTKKYGEMEKTGASFEELEELTVGSLRKAVLEGNAEEGTFMAGQISGLIKEEQTAKQIIERLFNE
jgi:enoyl-[acyl-carrier protein] reductase II